MREVVSISPQEAKTSIIIKRMRERILTVVEQKLDDEIETARRVIQAQLRQEVGVEFDKICLQILRAKGAR